jgi:hypothetical protein
MVRDHAAAAAEQLEMLRLQVSPYFRPAAEPGASPGEEDGATHARMRALAKADRWRDEVIRRDFTASTDTGSSPLQVTTTAFWREFARAERLAASLAREGR